LSGLKHEVATGATDTSPGAAEIQANAVRPSVRPAPRKSFQRHVDAVCGGLARSYCFGGTSPAQQTVASALQVCSSKTMKSKKSSQVTVFFPTVYFLMPRSAVHFSMYLSRSSWASLAGPSLP